MALTPKQRRFVEQYLVDLNATQAAIRAGYSAKTANREGARQLSKVDVRAAISSAQRARSQRTAITQDYVLSRLQKEAEREGEGSSHAARISALKLLGDHLGLFGDAEVRRRLEALEKALDSSAAESPGGAGGAGAGPAGQRPPGAGAG